MIDNIYLRELQLNKINTSDTKTPVLNFKKYQYLMISSLLKLTTNGSTLILIL